MDSTGDELTLVKVKQVEEGSIMTAVKANVEGEFSGLNSTPRGVDMIGIIQATKAENNMQPIHVIGLRRDILASK